LSRRRAQPAERIVAVIGRKGRFPVAEPIFERGPQFAVEKPRRPLTGRMALLELGPGRARVIRELGRPDVARDVVEALVWDRLDRRGFGGRIEDAAHDAAREAAASPGARRDLTGLPTFTVDPATARDFDDAVSAAREGDGVRLWIHIADVAAHVKPGSALDREAYRRGTSTYVPGSVEPMLPQVLSAGACSLVAGEERLAVTTEILLDGRGRPASASFYRSLIRSDVRIDYDELDQIFSGGAAPPSVIAEPLEISRAAAAALAERRSDTALEVVSSEPDFSFDEEGNVAGAGSIEQTESHRLIEQLMVVTNEQVAQVVEQRGVPTLFRVHEQPDPNRIEVLFEQLESLGLPTPPMPPSPGPSEAAVLAARASSMVAEEAARRGHGRAAYTSLVLRALKQAHYSDRNLGHAGLGSPAYSHFTSPIRRYPDLIAHRSLLSVVGEGEQAPSRDFVAEAGIHCSERERHAGRVERDADDVCAAFLLQRELFDGGWERRFEGEVSGVIGAGTFVTFAGDLGDVYEGFLPARRLRGERFELNTTETALVGSKTGREVRFGDPVDVRVERVEAPRGRVDLEPADG
jgi:ribonuclease R